MSNFIPNSFQTPNEYVDKFMYLLTGEEWKVLTYAVRRIFGFQKRQDTISLTQFERGKRGRDGTQLDYGTGLARPTIRRALDSLIEFKLLIEVAPNDSSRNEGACYALQLDSALVDVDGLIKRAEKAHERYAKQMAPARNSRSMALTSTPSVQLTPPDQPDLLDPVSSTYPPPSVELIALPNTENKEDNKLDNQRNPDETPPPNPPLLFPVEPSPRPAGSVGVNSRHSLQACIAYARWKASQGGSTIRDAEAVGRARYKDGMDDDLIAEYLKRTPEQIAAEQAAPKDSKMTFGYAVQYVHSMAEAHGRNPLDVVNELPVDDDVRARLVAKFSSPLEVAHVAD